MNRSVELGNVDQMSFNSELKSEIMFMLFTLFDQEWMWKNNLVDLKFKLAINTVMDSLHTRTTDAQRGNNLHCMAKNSLPLPNF